MMLINMTKQKSNHVIEITPHATKKAYLTLIIYMMFYFTLTIFQGILPFNQTLAGLVTIVQMFVCLFLTISVVKLNDTSSIFLYLLSLAIMRLSEINRIICEAANLAIMIELSTVIFFMLVYYCSGYQQKINQLTTLDENQIEINAQDDLQVKDKLLITVHLVNQQIKTELNRMVLKYFKPEK